MKNVFDVMKVRVRNFLKGDLKFVVFRKDESTVVGDMKKHVPFYPILFMLWYSVSLYVYNRGEAQFEDVWRSLVVSLVAISIIWGLLVAWFRNWAVGAFFSWLVLVFCLTYRLQYELIFDWFPRVTHGWASTIPFVLFGAAWYATSWFTTRLAHATFVLNVVGGILLLVPISEVAFEYWEFGMDAEGKGIPVAQELTRGIPGKSGDRKTLPNIYYIILDGYGRSDVLKDMYGFNNHEFIAGLHQRGFFVARNSQANYPQTVLSLASSLNLQYLTHLPKQYGPRSQSRAPLMKEINENLLMSFLQAQGYQTVAFSSGIAFTELRSAEQYISVPGACNEWELLFLGQTPFPFLMQHLFGHSLFDVHKHRLKYMSENVAEVIVPDRPSFVFAHFVAPHPPFVLGEQAPFIGKENMFSFRDGSHYRSYYQKSSQEYQKRYLEQLKALNGLIVAMLDKVLSHTSRPSVIVLQGDHGPGAFVDWEDRSNTNLRERMSILNAIYIPEGDSLPLYHDITPVNTFRMILQEYFKVSSPLLEDEAFFALMRYPFDFSPVPASP